mmetsp:Transcript_19765/g.62221  ORF Transcript_19765/g.62221 Transcript_19765/m.62221 type:complete len:369 (+) Transcript_19765:3-1109(+)
MIRRTESSEVAVVAPSSGLAAAFPQVRDLGVRRLEALLEMRVRVMESCYLTTEQLTPARRGAELTAAFGDPRVALIVCAIGGDDAIRVLEHVDVEVVAANPKPLMGFSDSTSLHLLLFELGVLSLYGGALLTQFAMPGGMHAYTQEAILAALFGRPDKPMSVRPSEAFLDGRLEWADPANLGRAKDLEENPGWEWHNCPRADTRSKIGTLWGGCLEILFNHLAARTCVPEDLNGFVLFVETSEIFPPDAIVYAFFQCLGELGVLQSLAALLVGRPQTVDRDRVAEPDRDTYRRRQKRAVLRAVQEYTENRLPVIFDLDFGHTDPQLLVPVGGTALINPHSRTITFTYERAARRRRNSPDPKVREVPSF